MIEIEGLSRTFGAPGGPVRALDRVSFRAERGTVTGLLGPNGAGKTTLLRVVAGILRPTAGRVQVEGFDVASHPVQVRARLGLLTEEPGLPDRLTPLWHVSLHASLRGFPRREAVERAGSILSEMGLDGSLRRRLGSLSRGSKLKVALARALLHDPAVLLLDEPTAGLDIETAAWLRERIARRAARGRTILIATNNPNEAQRLCGHLVLLRSGRLLFAGDSEAFRGKGRPSAGAGPGPLPSVEEAYLAILREGA